MVNRPLLASLILSAHASKAAPDGEVGACMLAILSSTGFAAAVVSVEAGAVVSGVLVVAGDVGDVVVAAADVVVAAADVVVAPSSDPQALTATATASSSSTDNSRYDVPLLMVYPSR
jgi:hypothetical protein